MNTAADNLVPPDELIAANGIGIGNFREIGELMVKKFLDLGLVDESDVVVDIGCGLGRHARPLTKFLSPKGIYHGLDINRNSIEWCKEKYAQFDNFKFEWMDIRSGYYNKNGGTRPRDYAFNLPDNYADFVLLASVFTHMFIEDVSHYLNEIRRILKPMKRAFITYFLIDETNKEWVKKNYHLSGADFVRDKDCPETMVLLSEERVIDLYKESGLVIDQLQYGSWAGGNRQKEIKAGYQDIIISVKPGPASFAF